MPITCPENDKYQKFYQFAYGESPEQFTYIVSCDGSRLLKIGRSKTPEWRLLVMQVGCPNELSIVWCWPDDIEAELHEHFADRKVRGEWYDVGIDEAIQAAAWLSKRKWKRETNSA